MDNVYYGEELKRRLLTLRHLKATLNGTRDWVNMRCPLCGDSKKDPNKKRMYIKVKLKDGENSLFCCHNCNTIGPTESILPLLFDGDYEILSLAKSYGNELRKNPKYKYYKMTKRKDVKLDLPPNTEFNKDKIKYINKRLGIKLTNGDIRGYKIVIDFYDFLYMNRVENLTRDKRVCDKLETDYFGFLTLNNDYLVMRNIRNSEDKYMKRYEVYSIFGNDDTTKRMYIMPTEIDITQEIEINIAEGVFDILGVFHHIKNKETKNKLYVAVCGSGYESVIRYIISKYGVIFHKINIFSDSDKDVSYYRNIKRKLGKRVDGDITVYYNKIGKDYGVPKEEIDLKYVRI